MRKDIFFDLIEILILLVLVILPIRFFLFEPFFVRGESMEPNFHNFDYLIIDKLTYRFQQPQRGDIVVFHPPFDNRVYYIKRIIGLPGERVSIKEDKIIIFNKNYPQGFVLEESYLPTRYNLGNIEVTLKNDEYFVLGDNREASYDSRKWGPVKRDRIIGKVFLHISLPKLVSALVK